MRLWESAVGSGGSFFANWVALVTVVGESAQLDGSLSMTTSFTTGVRTVEAMALFSDSSDALKTGADILAQEATLALDASGICTRDIDVSGSIFPAPDSVRGRENQRRTIVTIAWVGSEN